MEKDTYFVAVKVFLEDGKGNLLVLKDRFGDYDLPGGRLLLDEFSLPLEQVVARKMQEELGAEVMYSLGKPVVHMRHERDEVLQSGKKEKRRIFAVGYTAEYDGGEITLGKNHERYEWVSLRTFRPAQYFTGGWLRGVQDYLATFSHS